MGNHTQAVSKAEPRDVFIMASKGGGLPLPIIIIDFCREILAYKTPILHLNNLKETVGMFASGLYLSMQTGAVFNFNL